MSVLEVKDLHVTVEGKEILKGVNLKMSTGEIHAIMGPNGTGKSTLSSTIMEMPLPSLRLIWGFGFLVSLEVVNLTF